MKWSNLSARDGLVFSFLFSLFTVVITALIILAPTDSLGVSGTPFVFLLNWQYTGGGGFGNFPCVARDPDDSQVILAGSDVAGLFLTEDGGASWKNVSKTLDSYQIHDITFAGSGVCYLSTTLGVYRNVTANDYSEWELKNDGIETSSASNDGYASYAHPVSTVTVDPNDTNCLWAGIGETPSPHIQDETDDAYHVYYSSDGGGEWEPKLTIEGANIASIIIDPDDSSRVWVGSDRGLYYTNDTGEQWFELGIPEILITEDMGASWQSCDQNESCPDEFRVNPSCTQDTNDVVSNTCLLPLGDSGHPDIREIELSSDGKLVVMTWDSGHSSDSSCSSTTLYINDSDLNEYRGGPYMSDDNGITFDWLLYDDSGSIVDKLYYRCEKGTEEGNTTQFPFVEIDPGDSTHMFFGSYGKLPGIYELEDGSLSWWADCDPSTNQYESDCWEGGASLGIAGHSVGPKVKDMEVIAFDGAKQILFAHDRGVSYADWSSSGNRFNYTSLATDLKTVEIPRLSSIDLSGTIIDSSGIIWKKTWTGTGLDDTCVRQTAVLTEETSSTSERNYLFMGVGDGGLLVSINDGESWWSLKDNLKDGGLTHADIGRAVLADQEAGTLYMADAKSRSPDYSAVAVSSDYGTSWTVIGGENASGCFFSADCGLSQDEGHIISLAIDYSSPAGQRRILAGGSKDGLFLYDPAVLRGLKTWKQVTGCPYQSETYGDVSIEDILTDEAFPNYAFITVDTSENGSYDRVYVADLSDPDNVICTIIAGEQEEIYAGGGSDYWDPVRVAVAKYDGVDHLIVGAHCSTNKEPCIVRSAIDLSDPAADISWTRVFDPRDLIDQTTDYERWKNMAKHEFWGLAVNPDNPSQVAAGLYKSGSLDYYIAQDLYFSSDGGASFSAVENFDARLPVKRIMRLDFHHNPDGDLYIYADTPASVYRAKWPALTPLTGR